MAKGSDPQGRRKIRKVRPACNGQQAPDGVIPSPRTCNSVALRSRLRHARRQTGRALMLIGKFPICRQMQTASMARPFAFLLIAVVEAALLLGNSAFAADDCSGTAPITLTGRIRSIGTVQEEAGETPQTHFLLGLLKPWCGLTTIDATLPGLTFCAKGDVITLSGEYYPPARPMWIAGFSGRRLIACEAPPHGHRR